MAKKKKAAEEPSVVEAAKALTGGPDISNMPWINDGVNFDLRLGVRIKLITPMLGTVPASPEIFEEFIIGKIRKELTKTNLTPERRKELELRLEQSGRDELESVPESDDKGYTTFEQDEDGNIIIYERMILGFLKAAAEAMKGKANRAGKELDADGKPKKEKGKKGKPVIPYQSSSYIDKYVFVTPRRMYLYMPGGENEPKTELDGVEERPLRAQTPKGPRVALARSDMVEEGTEIEFEIDIIDKYKVSKNTIELLLRYGAHQGLGQFRNGGFGRFMFKMWEIK